jgi:ddrB-like ParB superfamily domain
MPSMGDGLMTEDQGGYQAEQSLPYDPEQRTESEVTSGFHGFLQRATQTVQENPWLEGQTDIDLANAGIDKAALPQNRPLTSEQANEKYAVPGYLRFNTAVAEGDAALQNQIARQKQWDETVMARTDPHVLWDIGASLAGSMTDPTNAALAFSGVPELAGEAIFGAAGEAAYDATQGVSKVGKLWNGVPQGVGRSLLAGSTFAAKDFALDYGTGHPTDFDMGQELANVAGFAVLHGAMHAGLNALGMFGSPALAPTEGLEGEKPTTLAPEAAAPAQAPEIGPGGPAAPAPTMPPGEPLIERPAAAPEAEAAPPPPAPGSHGGEQPDDVKLLNPDEKRGAFALAVDRASNDEDVDVGRLVSQAIEPPDLERLDEITAAANVESWRPLPDEAGLGGVAITTRGTEVPVRFGLVEMSDLTTSHGDDMGVNGAYPGELQPRERERAGAHARNLQLEKELNPKLLMGDVSAAAGAPIVSPYGVVESGNGRTIALRRSAATGTEGYQKYVAELQAQGFPVEGMRQPVLVRMRSEPMTGAARAGLAREMNADVTERMSPPEQAMADAQKMDPATMQALGQAEDIGARRRFARTFIERVAPDQIGEMVDQNGHLSATGERRIAAALVAKAYGDKGLVEALYDTAESTLKGIGRALTDAAPAWAAMRASMDRGETPGAFNLNDALVSAVQLVKAARDAKEGVGSYLAQQVTAQDIFTGRAVSQATEAFLHLFYRNDAFTQVRAADDVGEALKFYARWAMSPERQGGADIFGHEANADQAVAALRSAYAKKQLGWDERAGVQRAPGGTAGAGGEADRPVSDVREPGVEGLEPGDGGARSQGGGGAGEGGDGARGDGGQPDGERAGEPGRGGAGPGVPGEPGGEPGAEGPAAVNPAAAARIIAADPELQALQADLERATGKPIEYPPGRDPATLAEAVRAAAACLIGEL